MAAAQVKPAAKEDSIQERYFPSLYEFVAITKLIANKNKFIIIAMFSFF